MDSSVSQYCHVLTIYFLGTMLSTLHTLFLQTLYSNSTKLALCPPANEKTEGQKGLAQSYSAMKGLEMGFKPMWDSKDNAFSAVSPLDIIGKFPKEIGGIYLPSGIVGREGAWCYENNIRLKEETNVLIIGCYSTYCKTLQHP